MHGVTPPEACVGPLLIFGASGHGKVVADAALEAGFGPVVFADDDASRAYDTVLGLPIEVIGVESAIAWIRQNDARVVVAIGNNRIRARVLAAFGELRCPFATIVHPRAIISSSAKIGVGTVVFAGAIVQADAVIGDNVILNTACTVDHDCVVADHVHVCPGVNLAGDVTVEEGAQIGIGASAIQGTRVGAWSIVGAGASVVRDVPANVVAHGMPAQVQRNLEPELP